MTETRKRRVIQAVADKTRPARQHVAEHKRAYITAGAGIAGTVLVVFGDLVIGALGNGLWSVMGPVFGIK